MLQDIVTPFHIFGRHFSEFMEGLTAKAREKIDYGLVLLKTQNRLSTKFVKIFEEDYIVVLFNGFQKKGQKTPESEIAKALKIKEEYYEYKRRNGSGL